VITPRVVLFLLPVALFLIWLIAAAALGRKPSRFVVNVALSLLLLLYFAAVAGTGIFWVAAQELPIFDWHYLLGYICLGLVVAHVVLNWRALVSIFRIRAKKDAERTARGSRGWEKPLVSLFLYATVGVVAFWLGSAGGPDKLVVLVDESAAAGRAGAINDEADGSERIGPLPRIRVEMEGEMVPLAEYYHAGSSYPALARLSGVTWRTRPAVYKKYRGKPEVTLPSTRPKAGGTVLDAAAVWRAGGCRLAESSMTIDELSTLLFHTQGITGRVGTFELRSAPSAGALYPVDMYVVVSRVEGVDPGLYHYSVKNHALVKLKDGLLFEEIEALAGSPHLFQPAAATIVFTVTFGRSGFKYRDRAYRYVNMDTGHAVYNLTLSAASLGYSAPVVARFDDRALNAFLDVETEKEAALLLVPLGRPAQGARKTALPEPRFAAASLEESAAGAISYISLIHGGTGLVRTDEWVDPPARPAGKGKAPVDGVLELPDPAAGRDLFPVIRERRSVRNYTREPMSTAELSALCVAAKGTGETCDPFLSLSASLNLYVVVRDVKGIAPGVYRFVPESRSLVLCREGDFSLACRSACLNQDFCATADVDFVKTVEWKALPWPDGERGYRYACLRAGMVGEGLYLQATALGMGVCGVGAFMDGQAAEIIGCNMAREAVLYVTAVGK